MSARMCGAWQVLRHLGLDDDPIEKGKAAVKAPKAPRPLTAKEKEKQRHADAKSRLQSCLARSAKAHDARVASTIDRGPRRCGGLVSVGSHALLGSLVRFPGTMHGALP